MRHMHAAHSPETYMSSAAVCALSVILAAAQPALHAAHGHVSALQSCAQHLDMLALSYTLKVALPAQRHVPMARHASTHTAYGTMR